MLVQCTRFVAAIVLIATHLSSICFAEEAVATAIVSGKTESSAEHDARIKAEADARHEVKRLCANQSRYAEIQSVSSDCWREIVYFDVITVQCRASAVAVCTDQKNCIVQ